MKSSQGLCQSFIVSGQATGSAQPRQNCARARPSSFSGLTVDHIDVGCSQPGATGNYGGYIDDITLTTEVNIEAHWPINP